MGDSTHDPIILPASPAPLHVYSDKSLVVLAKRTIPPSQISAEAIGQGESAEECLADLRAAVNDVLAFRRKTAARSLGKGDRLETLADMKRATPLTHLNAHGCVLAREGGNHSIWKNPVSGEFLF